MIVERNFEKKTIEINIGTPSTESERSLDGGFNGVTHSDKMEELRVVAGYYSSTWEYCNASCITPWVMQKFLVGDGGYTRKFWVTQGQKQF